jgi:hypothetical protein
MLMWVGLLARPIPFAFADLQAILLAMQHQFC